MCDQDIIERKFVSSTSNFFAPFLPMSGRGSYVAPSTGPVMSPARGDGELGCFSSASSVSVLTCPVRCSSRLTCCDFLRTTHLQFPSVEVGTMTLQVSLTQTDHSWLVPIPVPLVAGKTNKRASANPMGPPLHSSVHCTDLVFKIRNHAFCEKKKNVPLYISLSRGLSMG